MSAAPLPPLPGGDDTDYRPVGRSIVALLTDEHQRIDRLCRQLADPSTDGARRGQLVEVLAATVTRHLSGEHQYLHPTVRAVLTDGGALADREVAADAVLLEAVRELSGTPLDDPGFAGAVEAVTAHLHRHTRTAATELFGPLRAALDDADLIRLGNRVEVAEEAAPTRPHPGSPATPPWNRLVDPALGVVDKLRDVVSGRPTRVEDVTG